MDIPVPSARGLRKTQIACWIGLSLVLSALSGRAGDLLPQTRSRAVRFNDLDLSRERDQTIARERVYQLARRLCTQMADREDLSRDVNYKACVAAAVLPAMDRLAVIIESHDTHLSQSLVPVNLGKLNKPR